VDFFQAGQVVLNYPSLWAIWEIHCKTTFWITATQSLSVHFQSSHLLIGIGRSSHFKSRGYIWHCWNIIGIVLWKIPLWLFKQAPLSCLVCFIIPVFEPVILQKKIIVAIKFGFTSFEFEWLASSEGNLKITGFEVDLK